MTESPERLHLPRFRAALAEYQDELSTGTYWRWSNGIFPNFVRWLIERPILVRAFCADVNALHQSPPTDPQPPAS